MLESTRRCPNRPLGLCQNPQTITVVEYLRGKLVDVWVSPVGLVFTLFYFGLLAC
jgi:hypothetical protein